MKSSIALVTLLAVSASAFAADTSIHRYVVESATPPSTQGKAKVNDASVGVHWLRSYSTADKSTTYSLYEASGRSRPAPWRVWTRRPRPR
jgi:hypothetical protein